MTMLWGCWTGAIGIACAEDAKAKAKAMATSLLIVFSLDRKIAVSSSHHWMP
jgi:hypothetical protein